MNSNLLVLTCYSKHFYYLPRFDIEKFSSFFCFMSLKKSATDFLKLCNNCIKLHVQRPSLSEY